MGRRWDAAAADFTDPLRGQDLDLTTRGRLLERAEVRARRCRSAARITTEDWFWLAKELALVLPTGHPKLVHRWRDDVRRARQDAERLVDSLRRLEAVVLAQEPETDAWLRRRLGELTAPGWGGVA